MPLALFFGSSIIFAQYRLDHWTADNGLPQNSVRDIVQTRDGYLWLTTFDGLVRFDGVRFTVFNKSNSPGIANNRFILLFEDRHGDLWATLETDGLVRRHQGRFTTYRQGQGLPGDFVNALGDDGQGNLIVLFNDQAFRWWEGSFQPANDLRLPDRAANPDEQARPQHLAYRSYEAKRAVCFVDGQLRAWSAAELPLVFESTQAAIDEQGNAWFVMQRRLVRTTQGRLTGVYSEREGLPRAQPRLVYGQRRPLQTVASDPASGLWVTDLDSLQSRLLVKQPPAGLAIYVSYADREGNYWFGTLADGLYRARQQTVTAYAREQGLKAVEVYPLLADRAGALWVGGYGLFRFKDGGFTDYSNLLDLFAMNVTSLYEDRAGRLWINGRWRWENGRIVRASAGEAVPDAMKFVWTMCEDGAGARWAGAEHGVRRYHNGMATQFTTQDGLAGNDTKVIIEDNGGGLWLGSYGGLTHYHQGKFTRWTEADGLPGKTVRALRQDGDGTLWIGTYDSGLGRFKDGRFTRYATKDGLFDNGVFQILEDDAGYFWMSSNRGIYRVRKQELNDFADGKITGLTSIAYNKSDGMPSAECNGGRWPAGVKTNDGRLWFPTMGGVAMIDPARVRTNTQPPPVVIEAMRVDNQLVSSESWASAIEIKPQQQNFEIEYTALSFINSEQIRFRYKLEGADQDWIEAGPRRTAYFSYVPPGEYVFRVVAANSDGVWNMAGQSLRITVLAPFYRRPWFLTLLTCAVIGLVAGAVKLRFNQLQKARHAQEHFSRQLLASQEQERQRIAAELHDSLGQSLLIIKNRAFLALNGIDDQEVTKEQLDEISASAAHAIQEAREIAYNLRPYQLERFGLTKTLRGICAQAESSSGIQFTAALDVIDDLFAKDAEINLYRIVQESVNNIIKHSRATEAKLTIRRHQHRVSLQMRDNGQGFTIADRGLRTADWKRGTLSSANPQSAIRDPQAGGFGLIGIAERARMLGGACTIDSQPGQGTTIRIEISLPRKGADEY